MVLLLDNYDSFTYNLRDYILQTGNQCCVVRNDEMTLEEIAALDFTSAVISPGPKTPREAGITMQFIERFYATKPILGICLGHQAIGEFFGAKVIKANKPVHGKTSVIKHNGHYLFNNLPQQLEVMRYHSLILDDLTHTPLQVTATSAENEIMAVAHPELKIAGVQFHPESVLTTHGLQIMKNWFDSF
ncbi:MAG TPA: aminodeoxychorismate/anthranilate synthase component II [Chitinophagales bacterium]|nr:aminodeoxychorismate/anthranilate synthase component II [Chitinophagales bacterium]